MRQGRRAPGRFAAAIVSVVGLLTPASAYAQGGGPLAAIQDQLDAISAQIQQLGEQLGGQLADQYVPFKVQIPGGLCDSAASPSSNPEIIIDSDGDDLFVVTSILVKRALMNPVDFLFLTINGVAIDGTMFDTRTGNLFGPIGGEFAVLQSADILGTSVRLGSLITPDEPGGNVPHQIAAGGTGFQDIRVEMFCRSDNRDMSLETILVAGWKKPSDTITVAYVPGN